MNTIQWEAVYTDGSVLRQYQGEAKHGYADIDRTRLASFSLYRDSYTKKILTFHLQNGQKLVYRQRVKQKPNEKPVTVCYMAGWHENVQGVNVQSIAYVFEDGRVEIAGAWNEQHPIFYPPKLLEFEQ